jgi:hypothetical protein
MPDLGPTGPASLQGWVAPMSGDAHRPPPWWNRFEQGRTGGNLTGIDGPNEWSSFGRLVALMFGFRFLVLLFCKCGASVRASGLNDSRKGIQRIPCDCFLMDATVGCFLQTTCRQACG